MEGYRWKAAVITLSDKGYAGKREDRSGPLICEMIKEAYCAIIRFARHGIAQKTNV